MDKRIIISVRHQDLKNLNKVQTDYGFSTLSEAVRFSLKQLADSTLSKGNQAKNNPGGFSLTEQNTNSSLDIALQRVSNQTGLPIQKIKEAIGLD